MIDRLVHHAEVINRETYVIKRVDEDFFEET
jgi:restriction endonuclease Mrr